jgi:AbrB family looped-hinge helix DNA binding protein
MAHKTIAAHYAVSLGARGRVVLPVSVRRKLDLHEGDRLILSLGEGGEIRLVSARLAVRSARGRLKPLAAGRRLVEELLRERRAEAEHG